MRLLRFSITVLALSALAAGYAASQVAFFTGRAPEYAAAVDRPAIRFAALLLLLLAVIAALIPAKENADR